MRTTAMDDACLFLAKIGNIQTDRDLADMDLCRIDLQRMQTVRCSPCQHFAAVEGLAAHQQT